MVKLELAKAKFVFRAELNMLSHSNLGYDYNQFPDNIDEIIPLCNDAVAALNAVNGQQFTCINSAELCKP